MVSITKRRILRDGGSRALALPPHWLDALGLDCGDTLEVIYDDVVVIRPLGCEVEPAAIAKELSLLNGRSSQEASK